MPEQSEKIIEFDNEHMLNVFGQFDKNIKKLENAFHVTIVNRGHHLKLIGYERDLIKTEKVLYSLLDIAKKGQNVQEQQVDYLIQSIDEEDYNDVSNIYEDYVCMTFNGKKISPKTLGQKKYVDTIRKNTIIFGIGPAGTGKTYLAMAMAVSAFKRDEVQRIILTRPAIEAGEKLGFLPGDLQQKVDPYLRPLYDALYEIMGPENFMKQMEKGAIEVAPLAYMRGRTLDNCFIVLDEAQNTTPPQMKMFLTRIGFGSKVVVTGDITQIDLADKSSSGLTEASKILTEVEGIGICHLTNKDVVRHPLVQKIIMAYEKHEKKEEAKKNYRKKR